MSNRSLTAGLVQNFLNKLSSLKTEDGAALIQVIAVSAFLLVAGFFLMQSIQNADMRSQNRIIKSNFMSVSDYLQQQAMDTDGLISSQ